MKFFLAIVSFLFSYIGSGLILMLVAFLIFPSSFNVPLRRYAIELIINVMAISAGIYSARASLRSSDKKQRKQAAENA